MTDQGSMDALLAASAARTAHEVAEHDYHHIRSEEPKWVSPYLRAKPKEA